MATASLLVAAASSLVVGLAFLGVARAVSRRPGEGDRVLARRAHALWWAGLGTYLVLQSLLTFAGAFDRLTTEAYLVSRLVALPLLCLSTWGITFYMLYLYTGRRELAGPLALAYGAICMLFFWVTYSTPQAVIVERWIVTLRDDAPLYRLLYALVGLPPILASLAYLWLLRRTREPEQRYRIALTAGSILLYVGSGLVARLTANDALIFATLVGLGSLAAAASLAAYYPPAALRARLREGRR